MLKTIELTKAYDGRKALDSLDLSVAAGEIYCLLGANGAGKTTTINLLLGFIEPTSGEALVDGINVAKDPQRARARVAYIPEQVNLYKHLTGLENLEYFTLLAGRQEFSRTELSRFLTDAGLPSGAINRSVGEYSKGMRQKVGIALAAARGAAALLLDEPTSGLDPQASNEFSQLLIDRRENGVAVLMATHDLFRAKETGNRVGIMKHGRLVAELVTSEIGHADLEEIYLKHMRD